MSKKNNLKFIGSRIIMDKNGKTSKLFNMEDIDPVKICNNIKELSKYYEEQIKDLKKEIKDLKSNKAYKELEKRNKELNEQIWHNCLCHLTDKEAKAIKDFKDKHYNKCAKADIEQLYKSGHFPATGCSKGSTYIYTISGSSLGDSIKIKCPICGEEQEVTDGDKF